MGRDALRFKQMGTGCIIPENRKLNQDGYYRVNWGGRAQMYHRLKWEEAHGSIPDGYEVNHRCLNRACSNLEHLELLDGTEHASLTNRMRYLPRKERAYEYWNLHRPSGTELAKLFETTISTTCRWIREWKKNN